MFKIGMFTSGYQRNPLEDIFEDAARFGYDYIELWGGRPHAFAPDLAAGEIDEVLRLRDKYGVPITGYCPEHNGYPYNFMIGSERQREDAVRYLKLCLDQARVLGSGFMLISPAHAGYEATYGEIRSRLYRTCEELAKHAEKVGVRIVVEPLTTMESNAFKSANDLVDLFEHVDSDYLLAMMDIVPPFQQQEQMMSYFSKLGGKLHHLHIIDSDGASDSHVMPGEGVLPMRELLEEIRDLPYEGTATIELVTGYINEPRLYAKRAIRNVRAMLGE
ncbi:fructoselysine 3-epimerase [Coriobacteriales bacterium OH1046]|nr:fructoselysine 3-epimerase [Coriobacteriales bacterium OH1046]